MGQAGGRVVRGDRAAAFVRALLRGHRGDRGGPPRPADPARPGRLHLLQGGGGGLVVGGFEPNAKPWVAPDALPHPFEFQLLPEDWDHFSLLAEQAQLRVPALRTAGIKKMYNGPESFTPDNQF